MVNDLIKITNLLQDNNNFLLFLNELENYCGYTRTSITISDNNKISIENTIFNEGKRMVFLHFRQFFSRALINKLEEIRSKNNGSSE